VPALAARRAGPAARMAATLRGRHPVVVFLVALLAGFALLAGLSILLGLLVTQVLTTSLGLGGPDESFVRTLAQHRDGTLTSLSSVGSTLGGAPVLPVIAALVAIGALIKRHWRLAAFAVFALTVESAAYRVTTLAIHRDRPSVPRLEHLPVDASYPSGHTAASIAVYSGLALLLTSRLTDRRWQVVAWTFAITMTAFVAMSRMYRGMHHPLDVAGGLVVGIGAIVVLVFACRAAGAAARARERGSAPA
jgi:undecaprenyl-diphosphatase